MRGQLLHFVLVIFSLVVVYCVYSQGIGGAFILDDINSIALNENIRITDLSIQSIKQGLSAGQVGIMGRPLPMLSFSLDYFFSGYDVSAFKRTSIVIHLLTFIAVLGFSTAALGIYAHREKIKKNHVFPLALGIAVIWALHPLQVSSVLYVVQRMTLMASLFSISALWGYIVWRRGLEQRENILFVGFLGVLFLALLGFFSKENAVLVPIYILLIEVFIFGQASSVREGKYKKILYCVIGFSVLIAIAYLHIGVDWYSSRYQSRDFNVTERLYTESRILFHYINWIVLPNLNNYGLYHDDIAISRGLIDPKTTILSIAGLLSLIGISFYSRIKKSWLGFGLCFFLVGHLLESSIIPLELAFEHRNYLPSLGIIFIIVMAIYYIALSVQVDNILIPILVVGLVYILALTVIRSNEWADTHLQSLSAAERHPDSARARWELASWYLRTYKYDKDRGFDDKKRLEKGVYHAERAIEVDDHFTTSLFGLISFYNELNVPILARWQQQLIFRLKNYPYHHESDSNFKRVIECSIAPKNICDIDEKVVDNIFIAVLENKLLTKKSKVNLYSGYAIFTHNLGRLEQTFDLLEKAAGISPSIKVFENLIGVSLELKRREEAIKYMEKLNSYNFKNNNLALKEQLEHYINECCKQQFKIKMGF